MDGKKLGNGAEYRTIGQYSGIWVRVPKQSDSMQLVPGGYPTVSVPEHWAHGKAFKGVILNCNFYGFSEADLGRRAVANVKVVIKTTGRGKKYLMLDIQKTSGAPEGEIKYLTAIDSLALPCSAEVFSLNLKNEETGQPDDMTVAFVPLPERTSKEETVAA